MTKELQNDTEIGRGEKCRQWETTGVQWEKKKRVQRAEGSLWACQRLGGSRRAFSLAWTGKALCQHEGVMGVSRVNRGSQDECVSILKKRVCRYKWLHALRSITIYHWPQWPSGLQWNNQAHILYMYALTIQNNGIQSLETCIWAFSEFNIKGLVGKNVQRSHRRRKPATTPVFGCHTAKSDVDLKADH